MEKIEQVNNEFITVKQKIIDGVIFFIKQSLRVDEVEIIYPSENIDVLENKEYRAKTLLKNKADLAIGLITINKLNNNIFDADAQELLDNIGYMLINQLNAIEILRQQNLQVVRLAKENSLFKTELDLAYEDLNIAHEELSEAYNLGILLNRNLSRMRIEVQSFLEQAPIAFGILRHRRLKIEIANSLILKLWGKNKSVIGKTLSAALPELAGQPYLDILDEVYTSGNRYIGKEAKVILELQGITEDVYFNFIYEPLKNESGITNAIMIIATDVTQLVKNRMELEGTRKIIRKK